MQPPPIPKQRGPSRTAIGCGVVAAFFFLVLVGLVIWWAARPRLGIDVATVAGPDAIAVVHLRDLRQDPGMMQMIDQLQDLQVEALREQLEQELPPGMGLFGRLAVGMERLNRFSPANIPEIVAAIEPGQGTNMVEVLVAGRVRGMGRLMVNFMGGTIGFAANRAGQSVTYRGRNYMDLDGDAFLSISRGTVLFATYREGMEAMIDRFNDGPQAPLITERLAPMEGDAWDFALVGENRGDIFAHLDGVLQKVDGEEAFWQGLPELGQVEWGWIGFDIHTGDWIRARLLLGLPDEAAAAEAARQWRQWLEPQMDPLRAVGLEAMLTVVQNGTEVQADLDVTQVQRAMRQAIRKAMEQEPTEYDPWASPDLHSD